MTAERTTRGTAPASERTTAGAGALEEAGRRVDDTTGDPAPGAPTEPPVEAVAPSGSDGTVGAGGTGAAGGTATAEPLEAFVARDETVEQLYQRSYPRLVGLARTILAGSDGAEEVVQEAFVRTLARWRGVHRSDALPYVRTAVVNLCRSRFRKKAPVIPAPEPAPSAEHHASATVRRVAIVEALAQLPERQREVVALRYFGELSTEETARELGIAPGTVKAHLHRALHALAPALEDYRHD